MRSFDDVIYPHQQRWRERQAESICSLSVEDELECRGLLDGEICGLPTFQDAVDVPCCPAEQIRVGRAVGSQPARLDIFACVIHHWHTGLCGQLRQTNSTCSE